MTIREMLQEAFIAGFEASGEGFNGEWANGEQYPYARRVTEPLFAEWLAKSGCLEKVEAKRAERCERDPVVRIWDTPEEDEAWKDL